VKFKESDMAKSPKKAAKKATKKAGGGAPKKAVKAASAGPAVRVRMFRHGLGDCFLVTFDAGGDEKHMLIDCGTLGNSATAVNTEDIADHLDEVLGDAKLDVVVATHEHKDHLSGFNGALKRLEGRVERVWLAWTENPDDDDAQALVKYKRDLGQALVQTALAAPASPVAAQVADLLGFGGDVELGAKFAETIDAAMTFVRKGLGAEVRYLDPGELVEEDWLPGFRFYVLGPPRSEDALKVLGGHGSDELYGVVNGLRAAALLRAGADEGAAPDGGRPFDPRFVRQGADERAKCYPGYADDGWRRIDDDWLAPASELALQLDSITNNTSLAFAIERIADGKVLLFPADAQQGHWLSWHEPDVKWDVKTPTGTRRVVAKNLLARTVFYKVGHHASHNATARGKGLEMMNSEDDLVAFIPVDRGIALTRNPKGSWQMPARPLYRRLLERCQGRVVRADLGWAANVSSGTEAGFKALASNAEWNDWEAEQKKAEDSKRVAVTDLYVEYLLK
jgi:hypothetical protein